MKTSFSSGRRIIDKVKISDGSKGEFTLKKTETDTETQSDKMATIHNGIAVSVQYEQECIPVGCVPPATVAISTGRGCVYLWVQGDVYLWVQGVSVSGSGGVFLCVRGVYLWVWVSLLHHPGHPLDTHPPFTTPPFYHPPFHHTPL